MHGSIPGHISCQMAFLFLPASGCTAGQHQTGLCYRQADLLRIHMAAELFQFRRQHIGKHCWCKTCSIGIHKEK